MLLFVSCFLPLLSSVAPRPSRETIPRCSPRLPTSSAPRLLSLRTSPAYSPRRRPHSTPFRSHHQPGGGGGREGAPAGHAGRPGGASCGAARRHGGREADGRFRQKFAGVSPIWSPAVSLICIGVRFNDFTDCRRQKNKTTMKFGRSCETVPKPGTDLLKACPKKTHCADPNKVIEECAVLKGHH